MVEFILIMPTDVFRSARGHRVVGHRHTLLPLPNNQVNKEKARREIDMEECLD
jgi:hypothetical protein